MKAFQPTEEPINSTSGFDVSLLAEPIGLAPFGLLLFGGVLHPKNWTLVKARK